uniref:Family with sequence similarity 169 member B n=1 Tax=Monodelphis domestica TaxID=13616 RepID=A0A5F8GL80_MONDO
MEPEASLRKAAHFYPVDILEDNPEMVQESTLAYYSTFGEQAGTSPPQYYSLPNGEKVQSFGERIILFILNYVIFGRLERNLDDDMFFLPHSAKEHAKILWRNGAAIAFYTIKMKGSLCGRNTSKCYMLPVLDTAFVRRKHRREGLGMKMLHDFCQTFETEDALGISCPISTAMYQGKVTRQESSEESGSCHRENFQDDELRPSDNGEINKDSHGREAIEEVKETKDSLIIEDEFAPQLPRQESLIQEIHDVQWNAKRSSDKADIVENKPAKQVRPSF